MASTGYSTSPTTEPAKRTISEEEMDQRVLWYSLREDREYASSTVGYRLRKGDIIKLGRAKLLIKELHIEGHTQSAINNSGYQDEILVPEAADLSGDETDEEGQDVEEDKPNSTDVHSEHSDHASCRICFGDDSNEKFISPCKCTGSMENIHYSCLKSWIDSKRVVRVSNAAIAYLWRNHECELCKT